MSVSLERDDLSFGGNDVMKKALERLSAILLELFFLIEFLSGVAVASDVIQQHVITGFKSLPENESVVKIPIEKNLLSRKF